LRSMLSLRSMLLQGVFLRWRSMLKSKSILPTLSSRLLQDMLPTWRSTLRLKSRLPRSRIRLPKVFPA